MNHVALYCRVSTDEQAAQGTIEAQRTFLTDYTKLYKLDVHDIYLDDGVSGTLPLDKRPAGMRLLFDAEHKRFDCVVVYKVDRLGRSLSAILGAYEKLETFGVSIKSANEPFESTTPFGRFMFQFLASLAELDRAMTLEKLTLGRDRVLKKGATWLSGTIPTGYDVVDDLLVPSRHIVPSLGITEAAMVQDLFQRIADGSTTVQECRRLNALGVEPSRRHRKKGKVVVAKKWRPTKIVRIVHSTVYIGQHTVNSKHGTITRDVPALVNMELWQQAHQTLDGNRSTPKNQKHRTYLLRGLIQCGMCGRTYVGQPIKRARTIAFYYRCSGRSAAIHPEGKDRCSSRFVKAEWLEDLVWGDCTEFINNPGVALDIAKQQLQVRQERTINADQEKLTLQQALAEKTEEREKVIELFRRKIITVDVAEKELEKIAQEETTLQGLLQAIKSQEDITSALADQYQQAETLLTSFQGQADENTSFEKKREVITCLVRHITIVDPIHIAYVLDKSVFSSQNAANTETVWHVQCPRAGPGARPE